MKSYLQNILFCLAAVIGLASCSSDEPEVITRGKLAGIYAEMLVTDQWIANTPGIRHIADTSLVYEPILNKYGYDSEDYRKSVDFYMNDPERFSRILRTSSEILDERLDELLAEKARLDAIANLPLVKVDFDMGELHPYLDGEAYVHYFDSLDVVIDSNLLLYRMVSIERGDTIFDGIRMMHRDSLAVRDSLAALDSLALVKAVEDSSLVKDRMIKKTAISSKESPEGRIKARKIVSADAANDRFKRKVQKTAVHPKKSAVEVENVQRISKEE